MSPRGRELNEQMRTEATEKIFSAALIIFATYGYHGTSIKQIARQAGLSYGLVYHYFPSKEALFRQLIDSSLDNSIQATRMLLESPGGAWAKIETLSTFLVREALHGDSFQYFLLVLHAMTQGKAIPGLLEHVTTKIETYYQVLSPVIAQAQKDGDALPGDPHLLAAAYFSFVQGLALLQVQGSGIEKHISPDLLMNVLRASK